MSGPRPEPTSLRMLRGNPGRRPVNGNESRPRTEIPPCPAHLSAEAKREWRRTARLLADLGLLARIDRAALSIYCEAWARWVEAERAMQQYGVMMKSPGGYPQQSPYLAVANRAMEQIRQSIAEFGMSPAARSRVHALPARDDAAPSVWDQIDALGDHR